MKAIRLVIAGFVVSGLALPGAAKAVDTGLSQRLSSALRLSTPGDAEDKVVLDNGREPVFWRGGPVEGVAIAEACDALACDEVDLEVNLSEGTLKTRGALQIAIRWIEESNDLDLYVYDTNGDLVGSSTGMLSTSEALLLPLVNGSYRVVVVPADSRSVTYEGLAQVNRGAHGRRARDLLPDLISTPPRRPQIATGAYATGTPGLSLPTGCYPEETIEQSALRCLRFDQAISNVGDGAFELRYRLDDVADSQSVEQRIYRSDGTWDDRHADAYEFHPTHAHFHYKDFAQAHLWRSNAAGDRLGTKPVRSSAKNGFCMIDVELYWWGTSNAGARTYTPPGGCFFPNEVDPAGGRVAAINGISPGWTDVYFWYVPDQYIEISDIEDGYYLLQTVADPARTVLEKNDRNNAATAHIQICGDSVRLVEQPKEC